jgi:hypothetical protein
LTEFTQEVSNPGAQDKSAAYANFATAPYSVVRCILLVLTFLVKTFDAICKSAYNALTKGKDVLVERPNDAEPEEYASSHDREERSPGASLSHGWKLKVAGELNPRNVARQSS